MENHKNEYALVENSIISFVWRGALVGLVAGTVVSLFRLAIEKLSQLVVGSYQAAHQNLLILLAITVISFFILLLVGYLIQTDPDIKGSGIPHVEGELKGLLAPNWRSVLWKKFIAGVISISMGFMLGREGPSIQLGAMTAKGLAEGLKSTRLEKRIMIASGAAAGLSAAFNAPIAGLLFVVEEIYHHFSRLIWISALVASIIANFVSLYIFGLKPVLAMPKVMPFLALDHYWILIVMGLFLGVMGFAYEKIILNLSTGFDKVGKWLHLPQAFYALMVLPLILVIGYLSPNLLGGGNGLIISLSMLKVNFILVLGYFIVRFIGSMLSYGSGLPGGIFLPILTLGALAGLLFGICFRDLGLVSQEMMPLFIVLGMAGYFGAISKAPLTGMILVTEMVGDLKPLMSIAVVTFVAYAIMDLLKGQPIYEAMLEKLPIRHVKDIVEPTLIELTVGHKLAGKYVRDLALPKNTLITTQVNHNKSQVVSGDTILSAGATIFLVVNEPDVGMVRRLLMS
ncbi:chloride channel protein [Streptococcus parauberis]|uniref:ClC family H(+)/Cl(-) exchange transporter n=1 Tax=Streptococcus parauberis TaxID=1348 RepID=UPI000447F7C4|nr:ClC family H(+)/Cl(-) exchange transporter [Streptococcus parauberis]UWM91648.1 chloride channel protein [Streptococcus parauberis]WEM64085.1 chloride channel protein [Streptococcus parauberis]GAJ60880.1 voltage gated chloride channel family protein [Streptococcus parauberis]